MRQAGDDAADQVEGQVASRAHRALDVVAKNPEVEHVPPEVHPPGVQEHRRDECRPVGNWNQGRQVSTHTELTRHHTPGGDERLQRAFRSLTQLEKKGENIEDNQGDRHNGDAGARSSIVSDRKHGNDLRRP